MDAPTETRESASRQTGIACSWGASADPNIKRRSKAHLPGARGCGGCAILCTLARGKFYVLRMHSGGGQAVHAGSVAADCCPGRVRA